MARPARVFSCSHISVEASRHMPGPHDFRAGRTISVRLAELYGRGAGLGSLLDGLRVRCRSLTIGGVLVAVVMLVLSAQVLFDLLVR